MTKVFAKNDLEIRTTDFSKNIVLVLKNIKQDSINKPIITQLVKSATSIGANYREAGGASSRKDFKNKIYICKKECREAEYWLEVIAKANPEYEIECRKLWKQVH